MCPYCPYNRIMYRKKLIAPYIDSLKKEIMAYADVFSLRLYNNVLSKLLKNPEQKARIIDLILNSSKKDLPADVFYEWGKSVKFKTKYFDRIGQPGKQLGVIACLLENVKPLVIPSVYIGGGTPTNAIGELGSVIDLLREKFEVGYIAIETTVADINERTVKKMKDYGIQMVSLGVQSFQDKFLKKLGRNYKADEIYPAIRLLQSAHFGIVNIDLMFVLPDQTEKDLEYDLSMAWKSGADQVTAYPLFTFPYSTVGKYLGEKDIKMPNFWKRRKFYKKIFSFFERRGFSPVSVWGFKKSDSTLPKSDSETYSSVTRDNYIGFGAGAGSRFQSKFFFNTFSIPHYERRIKKRILPVAISMDISEKLANFYWLYWRLYETRICAGLMKSKVGFFSAFLFSLAVLFGFARRSFTKRNANQSCDSYFVLTERGSFWIHLAQNYFVLDYINKVWSAMKANPFPKRISI